jgi:putative ABC transport system ATP-binding protein
MTPAPAAIRTSNLEKIYAGAVPFHALHDINLTIGQGEMVALMGASGSGKSTLMNILGCLDRASSGEYWLDGQPVASFTDDQLAEARNGLIGFVFQSFNLLPRLTSLQNVELPLVYAGVPEKERLVRARAGLASVGLAERVGNRPQELSGGQCQRVAIARAIVNRPRILMADEPTGALDSHTSREIMAIVQALNDDGMTVIVVTHDLNVAAYCRRRIQLLDGAIVEDVKVQQERLPKAAVPAGVTP